MVSEEQATISCKMLDLPPEIVLQISTMLNWQDILRLRQTCKAMSEASRTKMLWTHLFSLHKDPWLQAPRLERPIEQYSSTELEALVLRWISSGKTCEEIIHKGSNYKGGVIQTREIKSQKVECMCLIKGGRWLLTAFRNGSVYYCDLNSATLQKVPLIQKQVNLKTHPDSRIFMTVDVDEDSSVLSFNIALIFIQARSSEPPYETGWQFFNSNLSKVAKKAQQVQIWHVNLVVEESSRVTDGLAATKLTSFLLDPNVVWIHSYSLLGSHIALGIHCYYLEPNGIKECYCTMIIEWMRVHEGSLDYPRYCFSFEDPICAMHLLPQKRVFSINWLGDLYLQDYSTLPEITGILWSPDELEPLWTAPFKCRNIAFSTPQTLDGENQLFVLLPSGFNELFGILIYGLGNPLGAEHPVSIISLNESCQLHLWSSLSPSSSGTTKMVQ
ncbi:hypothetical protein CPB84DRAFT_1203209 [Gymnopilus junonius]|uniref:F-box domain-containing protein n=1 Tax=Gymnopilus junonius TaxID=109634 RepID=A0A9P5NNN2_GYMJU|nr:hypothetical protein CPB84DRAFT_1203209 [Gymnopilus junonius]